MSDTPATTRIAHAAELRVFPAGIFAAWAVLSFDRLADLWQYTSGGPRWMALLLPLSIDCLTAMAWLRYQRTGKVEALVVAAGAAVVVVAGNGVSAAITAGYLAPTLALTIAVAAIPPASGVVALHLLAPRKEEPWQSAPASATGGHEPAPTTAPPVVPSSSPPPSPTPAPPASLPVASGTAASAGNGGRSAASGSAAGPSSPTTSTAPGAAPRLPGRALTDADLTEFVREQGWANLSTKEIGSRLRGKGIAVGQRRVGPVKRAALNGH